MSIYVQHPKPRDIHAFAIELIEQASHELELSFKISYRVPKADAIFRGEMSQWRIEVKGDSFYHPRFHCCVANAMEAMAVKRGILV